LSPFYLCGQDPEQQKVIDRLAEFVVARGTEGDAFENIVREKEQNNPRFAFLFGGPYNDYYRWKLYELRNPGINLWNLTTILMSLFVKFLNTNLFEKSCCCLLQKFTIITTTTTTAPSF
jgi:hypothetical protein